MFKKKIAILLASVMVLTAMPNNSLVTRAAMAAGSDARIATELDATSSPEVSTPADATDAPEQSTAGPESEPTQEPEQKQITSIADAKAMATGTEDITVKGTVVFVDAKNVYVQDDTAGIDLFLTSAASSNISVGKVITATGTRVAYKGIQELSGVVEADCTIEDGETLPVASEHSIKELLDDAGTGTSGDNLYQSTRVKVTNAVIGAVNTSGNTVMTQTNEDATESSINVYQIPALDGIVEGDHVSFEAVVARYNGNVQLRIVSAEDVVKEVQNGSADDSISIDFAQWINGKDLGGAVSYPSVAGADTSAELYAVVAGEKKSPVYSTSSSTGTNYYIGGEGVGSKDGENNFTIATNPEKKFGKYKISFEIRDSATAAKEWTLSYSTDGETFTEATKFTHTVSGSYEAFEAEIPSEVNGSEKLFLRLTPGSANFKGTAIGTGGTTRLSNICVQASPMVSDSICRYVTFEPEAGEVMAGQELTLASATKDAVIKYTINDGAEQTYDANNKPVLTADLLKDGIVINAYASLQDKEDSVKTSAKYTQKQVGNVKATPNGGAVKLNTQVNMQCETEGAKIMYSSDDGATWTEYTEKLTLDQLPAVYKVKAVKDGYKDSNEVTLSYTLRSNEKYKTYFGQLHSHTSYSDGAGTCEEAFNHASQVNNLDFLAVTDHSNSFDNADKGSITDGSASTEWTEGNEIAKKYTSEEFVGLFGYEMTWSNGLGHLNTFNTKGFQSRTQSEFTTMSTALQNYYAKLKAVPDSLSQFNHPGTTFGDFSDFAYYDKEIDNQITTIEVGNGEGAIGSSGYFPSYEYYQRALDKGWHVAPTNNQDNHKGLWGDANTARSVVLADSLTQDNIYDAMRNYRVYATEDNDLNIYYTLDGNEMGSILSEGQTGDKVDIKAELSDATDKSIGKVEVITNGGLVLDEKQISSANETVSFSIDNNYSFYYLKITQTDGDIAVTAPVWVGEVEAAGINSLSTQEVLPVKGEALTVDLSLYNNEETALTIDSIEFMQDNKVVHSADLVKEGVTSVASMATTNYSFDYMYDGVGSVELTAVVKATLNGVAKRYESVLKLTYVTPEMVTRVVIDGTHYNDYVAGYYGGNVGNFTTIAGKKNVKVEVVKDKITADTLKNCALLIISAPAKKTDSSNTGAYSPSSFDDEFINTVKAYTDAGGTLITCGTADYQDTTSGQTATEMNKLLKGIDATTKLNSDEVYDVDNNGGQAYRLYMKKFNKDSKYMQNIVEDTVDASGNVTTEGQKYSAYSGCSVKLDDSAVQAGKAEALVSGHDTTYSIDCKDEAGATISTSPSPTYVEKGKVVALAHETLDSGANVFVSGTVFISDFEVKAELDNNWDLPYANRTIAENILDEVKVTLPTTSIEEVRKNGKEGDVYSVEGYVTAGTENENNAFFDAIYVQDDTAGITVFPYSVSGLKIGTKLRLTGYVDAYQGDKELQLISSEVISGDTKIYEPEKLSASDAMNYEKSGGKLVQVSGKVKDVTYNTEKTGVSQFWLEDENGDVSNVFIDGYILSGTTGKNTLADIVKVGEDITAVGLVYAHPEGTSDTAVTCLRVRNCDEITKTAQVVPSTEPTASTEPTESVAPTASTEPTASAEPTVSTEPTASVAPTASIEPTEEPKNTIPPVSGTQSPSGNTSVPVVTQTAAPNTASDAVKDGKNYTVNATKCKVTSVNADGTGNVTFTGTTKGKKIKSLVIGNTIKINGKTCKITAIANGAFKNCTKLKKVTIGTNGKTIGKEAFSGCKSLKQITIKSKSLKKIGKNALKGISKNAVIKVPKSKLKTYKKLFTKSTGFKKSMKLKAA